MNVINEYLAHLTPKQMKVIPLLVTGAAASDVAKAVKVSQGQISEWKKDRRFMCALAEARRSALHEAEGELAALAHEAVRTLRNLMLNSSSESTRLRAAAIVLARLDLWGARLHENSPSTGAVDLREVLSALVPAMRGS